MYLCLVKKRRNGPTKGTFKTRGVSVKKAAIAIAMVVAALSLSGCFVGKGKTPTPIITKG